jgi:hypothetical protein
MRLTLRVDKKVNRTGSGVGREWYRMRMVSDENVIGREWYWTRMVCVEEKLLLSELLYKVSE